MNWTEDHDNVLKEGIKEGLTAFGISEKINQRFALSITRNAVLGSVFRLGLSVVGNIGQPRTVIPKNNRRIIYKGRKRLNIESKLEHIKDMRDSGLTWDQIGDSIGTSGLYARLKAIEYGIFTPNKMNYFSHEDIQYIKKAWNDYVPVEDIADALNRSFGVIRQKILFLQRNGEIESRDASKTRLLRQYGEKALSMGATPKEALHAISVAKRKAFATAMKRARDARYHNRMTAIANMKESIGKGMSRNEAIFNARAEGATLEQIASEFDLTKERIRQICLEWSELIALKELNKEESS